jgi:CDP-diacylglycerol--glycerol-3-phosphate 3-phosphatidyltransferase
MMYLQDALVWRSLSIAVFAVAAVTDFFDGYIARNYEAHTQYGVFLDPLADKFLTFAGFFCLPFIDATQFPWWAISLIVVRDVVVTGMRLMAEKRNYSMITRQSAKLKTFSQMLFLYVTLLVGVFMQAQDLAIGYMSLELIESGILGWGLYLIVIITVYTGFEYIYFNRDIFSIHNNAST